MLYHYHKISDINFTSILKSYAYGAYMDVSAACYICVIPLFIWIVYQFREIRLFKKIISIYTLLFLIIITLITIGDLQIYKEWNIKISSEAFAYLKHPKEAFASAYSSPLLLLLFIGIIIFIIGFFSSRFIINKVRLLPLKNNITFVIIKISSSIILILLVFLGIRGGFGIAPMNPGFVYFSDKQFANHLALNSTWNLLYDYDMYSKYKNNDYNFFENNKETVYLKKLFPENKKDSTKTIFNNIKPNIVIIILESWTADVIKSLTAKDTIAPNFEKLIKDGLFFTNFYANGVRTPHGITSVIAGYPSTPLGSIINYTLKADKLPTISDKLKKYGYYTSYFYGGNINFDNMNAFIKHSGFEKISNKSDYSEKFQQSKWGVHDNIVFDKVINDLDIQKIPFFTVVLTQSSHEPFEVPMNTVFKGKDEASLFKNSVYYTDKSLGEFISKAKTKKWYNNTLFIFVADHGHRLPLERTEHFIPERFHIPCLFYGNVLADSLKGKKINTLGSQKDIVATILAQLDINHDEFIWSNNLFNKNRYNYVYYNFKNGFGWIIPEQSVAYDNIKKGFIYKRNKNMPDSLNNKIINESKAYVQFLLNNFKKL